MSENLKPSAMFGGAYSDRKSAGKRALYARSDREAIAAGRDLSRSCAIARRARRMGK